MAKIYIYLMFIFFLFCNSADAASTYYKQYYSSVSQPYGMRVQNYNGFGTSGITNTTNTYRNYNNNSISQRARMMNRYNRYSGIRTNILPNNTYQNTIQPPRIYGTNGITTHYYTPTYSTNYYTTTYRSNPITTTTYSTTYYPITTQSTHINSANGNSATFSEDFLNLPHTNFSNTSNTLNIKRTLSW